MHGKFDVHAIHTDYQKHRLKAKKKDNNGCRCKPCNCIKKGVLQNSVMLL